MQLAEYLTALRDDGARLADAARIAGLDAVVPTCPGWRVGDLVQHLGGVHRWAAEIVATGRDRAYSREERRRFHLAPTDDTMVDWFREGHQSLLRTLETADPELKCWSFLDPPVSPLFWARRQAHETAVHRADVELVIDGKPQWSAAFAVDGINELRELVAERAPRVTTDPPVAVALVSSDADAAWTVRIGPGGLRFDDGADPAAPMVTDTADRLYLLLWNRIAADQTPALAFWRERVAVI